MPGAAEGGEPGTVSSEGLLPPVPSTSVPPFPFPLPPSPAATAIPPSGPQIVFADIKSLKKKRYSLAADLVNSLQIDIDFYPDLKYLFSQHRAGPTEAVELMSYHRCRNVLSDHKPVAALLNIKVKRFLLHLLWPSLSVGHRIWSGQGGLGGLRGRLDQRLHEALRGERQIRACDIPARQLPEQGSGRLAARDRQSAQLLCLR